jgi:hypothetical protein
MLAAVSEIEDRRILAPVCLMVGCVNRDNFQEAG